MSLRLALLASMPLALGFASGRVCPVRGDAVRGYVPPGWVFGAMWSVIYICVGVVLYNLMKRKVNDRLLWSLVIVNLAFNLSWSCTYKRDKALGLWWIIACKLSLLLLAMRLMQVEGVERGLRATMMLSVYWVWLDVAALLNYNSISA